MISNVYKCLLLWPISNLGGTFEQKGAEKKKGGEGRGGAEMNQSFGMDG